MAAALPIQLVRDIDEVSVWAKTATITDQTTYEACSEALGTLGRMRRTIQQHFAQVKRPITRAHKEVVALEKVELARVTPAEDLLKGAVTAWLASQDALLQAEQEDAVRGMVDDGLEMAPVIPAVVPVAGQHRSQRRRTRVTDLSALIAAVAAGTVGTEVLTPNLQVLNKLARQHGDLFEVPGVEVEVVTTVVSR